MSLSPEQRDELQRLLADELRAAWGTAVADGATPAAIAEVIDERRRAVESSLTVGDDAYGRRDDPVDGGGIGEQH
jgi:hypothetical protein